MRFAARFTIVCLSLAAALPALAVDGELFVAGQVVPGNVFHSDIGDFNEDGHLDLVGMQGEDAVRISLGDGNGSFAPAAPIPLTAPGASAAVGDFNNDNHEDIVVSGDSVTVLLGDGTGLFPTQLTQLVGLFLGQKLAVGDFDDDGNDDVALVSYGASLAILLGEGDGTLRAPLLYPSHCRSRSITVSDFNGDSIEDLAVGSSGCREVAIHIGHGDGTFAPYYTVLSPGLQPSLQVRSADLDLDGHQDLVVAHYRESLVVHLGRGDGSFGPAQVLPATPADVVLADFDLDGKVDAVSAGPTPSASAAYLAVRLGAENGELVPHAPSNAYDPALFDAELIVGDFDEDGFPDVAVTDGLWTVYGTSDPTQVFLNRGPFAVTCNDRDGDSYGAPGNPSCPGGGADDCDDADSARGPHVSEICDGVDNDCDGAIDEEFDTDGDGFSDCGAVDCDDGDSRVFPDATEFCNLIDDSCDGAVDEPTLDDDWICDDGFPCSSESCGAGLGCVVGDCGAGAALHDVFPGPVVPPGAPIAVAHADFDENGNTDLAVASSWRLTVHFGAGDGAFPRENRIAAAFTPRAVAVDDFDGDQHADLLLIDDRVALYTGIGDGTFDAVRLIDAGPQPRAPVSGDVNEDGAPDLIVVHPFSAALSVLLGDGTGGFSAPVPHAVALFPERVALGLVDADLHLDLVTTSPVTGEISVLLGAGDGSFAPAMTLPILGLRPTGVAIADFDEDGFQDLVVSNLSSDDVSVLFGDGNGTFGSELRITVAPAPSEVVAVDLDGDDNVDVVVAARSGDLSVLPGNGDGTFRAEQRNVVGSDLISLIAPDVDGDGTIDVVTVGQASDTVRVLLGLGDTNFRRSATFGVGSRPSFVATGDFNEDGIRDLAVTTAGPDPDGGAPGELSLLLGLGGGSFGPATTTPVGLDPTGLAVSDFDGDENLDLVVINDGSNTLTLLTGNGDATFAAGGEIVAGGQVVVAGDVNLDGDPDLVTSTGNTLHVFLGNGDGSFGPEQTSGASGSRFVIHDVTGDGIPDAVFPGSVGRGLGDGRFVTPIIDTGCGGSSVDVARFDSGPDLDIVSGSSRGPCIATGQGSDTFGPSATYGDSIDGRFVRAADLDADGIDDVAMTFPPQDRLAVFTAPGDGTIARPASFDVGQSPIAFEVDDLNADGRLDIVAVNSTTDSVTVALNQGPFGCVDRDGDGFGYPAGPSCPGGVELDCDDDEFGVFPGAAEFADFRDNDCDLAVDETPLLPGLVPFIDITHDPVATTIVSWAPAPEAQFYEAYRGTIGSAFAYDHAPLSCAIVSFSLRDSADLPAGEGRYYLVRGVNAVGKGHLGLDSEGVPRPDLGGCP